MTIETYLESYANHKLVMVHREDLEEWAVAIKAAREKLLQYRRNNDETLEILKVIGDAPLATTAELAAVIEPLLEDEPDSSEGSIGEMLARGEFEPMPPVFGHPKRPVIAKLEAQVKVTDVDGVLDYINHLANELEFTEGQLGTIRATLMVNFGERQPGNRYGFTVKDDPEKTTSNMLIEVLGELTKRLLREERECMKVLIERDHMEERLDLLTAEVLQEDIDWSCHETKWDEATDEISRMVQERESNRPRASEAEALSSSDETGKTLVAFPLSDFPGVLKDCLGKIVGTYPQRAMMLPHIQRARELLSLEQLPPKPERTWEDTDDPDLIGA